jgi:hypothetical protein
MHGVQKANLEKPYFYQWQITYAKLPRKITKHSGRGYTILNEHLPDGSIRNAVEYTPRCRVVITENINSPTQQIRKRTMVTEILPHVNPEIKPITHQKLLNMFIKNIDLPDDDKAEFEAAGKAEEMAAMVSIANQTAQGIAGISGARLMKEQNELMLANLGMQPSEPQEQVVPPERQIQQAPQEQTAAAPQEEQTVQSPDIEEIGV